jgi:hypothetical protein
VPPRITDKQRVDILRLLDKGLPREAIAKVVGISPGQVSAIAAHLTMGTYGQRYANRIQDFTVNSRTKWCRQGKDG